MRILMIQPNYHSGGAEIAGNWPPSWVPYVGGALKTAGFTDIRFVDAMTNYIADEDLAEILRTHQPDLVLATAITPMIYKSQETLKLVKQICPQAKAIMGGVHPTYMYEEVLAEAPWVDYIIRGEGEEITINLVREIANGTDERDRHEILEIAFLENGQVVATPAHPPIADLNTLTPDWSLLDWSTYIYTPLNVRVAVPNYSRGCPFRCRFCSQWKFWRKYRSRSPKQFVDEIEQLVKEHQVGFFILADEEPTINKSRFIALCHELIDRNLAVHWGINTRVTDILRDEHELALYHQAGLMHVSLGTEAAAQLNLNVFRKETTIADNKRAVELLRRNGIVAEVQFIMGLPNETAETIQETYRMARDWKADMTNWNMVYPLALYRTVPGARGSGRNSRLLPLQLCYAHYQAEQYYPRRTPQGRLAKLCSVLPHQNLGVLVRERSLQASLLIGLSLGLSQDHPQQTVLQPEASQTPRTAYRS